MAFHVFGKERERTVLLIHGVPHFVLRPNLHKPRQNEGPYTLSNLFAAQYRYLLILKQYSFWTEWSAERTQFSLFYMVCPFSQPDLSVEKA